MRSRTLCILWGPTGHRVLIYYAGHGHTVELAGEHQMGYLVPADAQTQAVTGWPFVESVEHAGDRGLMEIIAGRTLHV